jgi:hypothetical protein
VKKMLKVKAIRKDGSGALVFVNCPECWRIHKCWRTGNGSGVISPVSCSKCGSSIPAATSMMGHGVDRRKNRARFHLSGEAGESRFSGRYPQMDDFFDGVKGR